MNTKHYFGTGFVYRSLIISPLSKMHMRTYFIFALFLLAGLSACQNEGPPGPVGPQGPQGPTGPQGPAGQEAFTFEYEVDFTSPDYRVILPFPGNFRMLDSDMALVYLLWGQETVGNEVLDIWRALPQTLFLEEGIVQYNYDFTVVDVSLFLEATFPRNQLGPEFLDDWIVRVVVIPAQFDGRVSIDYTDYYAVAEHFGLPTAPVSQDKYAVERPH